MTLVVPVGAALVPGSVSSPSTSGGGTAVAFGEAMSRASDAAARDAAPLGTGALDTGARDAAPLATGALGVVALAADAEAGKTARPSADAGLSIPEMRGGARASTGSGRQAGAPAPSVVDPATAEPARPVTASTDAHRPSSSPPVLWTMPAPWVMPAPEDPASGGDAAVGDAAAGDAGSRPPLHTMPAPAVLTLPRTAGMTATDAVALGEAPPAVAATPHAPSAAPVGDMRPIVSVPMTAVEGAVEGDAEGPEEIAAAPVPVAATADAQRLTIPVGAMTAASLSPVDEDGVSATAGPDEPMRTNVETSAAADARGPEEGAAVSDASAAPAAPVPAAASPATSVFTENPNAARGAAPRPAPGIPAVPAPSVLTPSVPAPSVPAPSVPAPSVLTPFVPAPSVPAPSVPAPSQTGPVPPETVAVPPQAARAAAAAGPAPVSAALAAAPAAPASAATTPIGAVPASGEEIVTLPGIVDTRSPLSRQLPDATVVPPAPATATAPTAAPAVSDASVAASASPSASVAPPLAPVTSAAAPAPAPESAAARTVAAQVAPAVVHLAQRPAGVHQLTLTVRPEAVGAITVRARISANGEVRVELSGATEIARDVLRTMTADLRRDLAAIAPHAHLSVAAGLGDAAGDRGPSGGSGGTTGDPQADARGARPEHAPRASDLRPPPAISDSPTDHPRAGAGGGLDIFA